MSLVAHLRKRHHVEAGDKKRRGLASDKGKVNFHECKAVQGQPIEILTVWGKPGRTIKNKKAAFRRRVATSNQKKGKERR
jgi:hypothetical protein